MFLKCSCNQKIKLIDVKMTIYFSINIVAMWSQAFLCISEGKNSTRPLVITSEV